MKNHPIQTRRRDAGKLALRGLRLSLAVVFSALGFGFLFTPGVAEELARAGIGPSFRHFLGVVHLFGGLALLVPRLAWQASLVLSGFVAGSALYLHGEGVGIVAVVPVSLVLALLAFGVGLRHRQRAVATVWREMLGRYADQQDSLRSETV